MHKEGLMVMLLIEIYLTNKNNNKKNLMNLVKVIKKETEFYQKI